MPENPTNDANLPALPDRYLVAAARSLESLFAAQEPDGHLRGSPLVRPFHPGEQVAIQAAAFTWATEHPLNPRRGDPKLLDQAVRLGDYLAGATDERGMVHYDSNGYRVDNVNQWMCHAWLEALLLIERELGAKRARLWRQRLEAAAATVLEEIRAWSREPVFHTRTFGTSPNHAALYAAFVYRAASVFDHPDWRDEVDSFMTKFARLQDVDGGWPEYEGPVIAYAFMTLAGFGLYWEYTKREDFRERIERSSRFLAGTFTPAGEPMMSLDGRIQHPSISPFGHFALSVTPEGRALADLATRPYATRALSTWEIARAVENYAWWHAGPVGRLPLDAPDCVRRLKQTAGIRRSGEWMWALQSIVTPDYPEAPWSLDRQTLVELHHAQTGPILTGANCKEHREAATFAFEEDAQDALPVAGALDDKVSSLDASFRNFSARLRLESVSAREFRIRASASGARGGGAVLFRLQPDAHFGAEMSLDGAARKLANEPFSVEGVRALSWGKAALEFDRPARVWWPMVGYNSYAADHRYPDLSAARPIVELRLTPAAPERTVVARVS